MVVFVISGASYGIGPELVHRASHDSGNVVFALVKSAKAAERLAGLSSTRNNVHVYFEAQKDLQVGYEIIARDISRTVSSIDVLINNIAWVRDCLGMQNLLRSNHEPNQINDLQQFFSNHVLDSIHITNAFIPLLRRGSLKKVVTITSEGVINHHSVLPSGLDVGVAYAMAKTALDMAVSRYSAIPELKQNGVVCVMVECEHMDGREQDKDNPYEQVQELARGVFKMIERLERDNSGRCIKLKERDLITF
ncbi:unnamed protein product [Rhizoctonia solani]|uniref:Uncharacterized protein n=1 Tax=Rhizoctonia solani TaxID=456999 RepID=A0A8H3DDL4_9AGAM|nr:unnamed protein product [Rhizoctonia solani]